jgi:hypothetical protein
MGLRIQVVSNNEEKVGLLVDRRRRLDREGRVQTSRKELGEYRTTPHSQRMLGPTQHRYP